MNIEKQAGKDLGRLIGAKLQGAAPGDIHFLNGHSETLEQEFRKKAHNRVLGFIGTLFDFFGEGHTKCARHVKALSSVPMDHTPHTRKASNEIFDLITDSHNKQAKADWLAGMIPGAAGATTDAALWLTGITTALTGAGGGAALWHAQKESEEEDSEQEAKRRKIQYYRQLTKELKEQTANNYNI